MFIYYMWYENNIKIQIHQNKKCYRLPWHDLWKVIPGAADTCWSEDSLMLIDFYLSNLQDYIPVKKGVTCSEGYVKTRDTSSHMAWSCASNKVL